MEQPGRPARSYLTSQSVSQLLIGSQVKLDHSGKETQLHSVIYDYISSVLLCGGKKKTFSGFESNKQQGFCSCLAADRSSVWSQVHWFDLCILGISANCSLSIDCKSERGCEGLFLHVTPGLTPSVQVWPHSHSLTDGIGSNLIHDPEKDPTRRWIN